MPVYCIEVTGSSYGCSRKLEDAIAAVERGRRRGVSWGKVVERKSVPRGLRADEWLPPFDGPKSHHLNQWTKVRREVRQELDASGATPDTEMDPGARARIARDAYDSCQKERAREILAGIPPIALGKTKYRVVHGDEKSLDLIGPRGGSSALVQSRNDPTAWAHNSMSGHTLKTVWYRKNPDFTFTRMD